MPLQTRRRPTIGGLTLSQQKPPAINKSTTRKERRAAARSGRPPVAAVSKPSPMRSPMVLLTLGAVLLGVVVIGVALVTSGQIGRDSKSLVEPIDGVTPQALWDGRALGSKSAPLTLEIYSDFQCPVCRQFAENTEPQLVKNYVETGKVRLVYKDLVVIGAESIDGAVASRCAEEQGRFWPFHDYLFANQGQEGTGYMTADWLARIAEKAGLNMPTYTSCVEKSSTKDAVQAESNAGRDAGVTGTPGLVLNGTLLTDDTPQKRQLTTAYQAIQQKLDAALSGGTNASPAPSPSGS